MITSEYKYPEWKTQITHFVETYSEVKKIEYKFIKRDKKTGELSWELVNRANRSIDLTKFFDEKYVNFVIIEDAKWNDNKTKAKIVVHLGKEQSPQWMN